MRQLVLLAIFLGTPVLSLAQTNPNSWDALNTLRPGQRIEVFETNLKNHKGTFSAVTGEAIQLREGASDVAIPRQNVLRVTLLEKSHRLRNAFIYGGVGAGAGAGISAAATRCPPPNGFSLCGVRQSRNTPRSTSHELRSSRGCVSDCALLPVSQILSAVLIRAVQHLRSRLSPCDEHLSLLSQIPNP